MATVVVPEPGYSPHNTQILDICSHCDRPLCPHCWNHPTILDEKTDLWICSNEDCKLEFHHYVLEDK